MSIPNPSGAAFLLIKTACSVIEWGGEWQRVAFSANGECEMVGVIRRNGNKREPVYLFAFLRASVAMTLLHTRLRVCVFWTHHPGCLSVLSSKQTPHLEHLLYVILMLGVNNAVHVPLQHFDQVPEGNTNAHTHTHYHPSSIAHRFSLDLAKWRWGNAAFLKWNNVFKLFQRK